MRGIACFLPALLLLAGCDDFDGKASRSTIIHNQIGRFVIVPAQNGYPAMVLDTAAGCVDTITKADNGSVQMDEVNFDDGTNSCNATKQLLVVDALSRVDK